MDIDYPDSWSEYEREGEVGRFRMRPPLRLYERADSNARLTVGPVIPTVPAGESPVTEAKLREEYGHTLPAHQGEYVQTILYDAMVAEGAEPLNEIDGEVQLPALFSDAPIDDDRFADLDWQIAVEYIRDDEETTRPASRPTPKLHIQTGDRDRAIAAVELLLSFEDVGFDLPASMLWRGHPDEDASS